LIFKVEAAFRIFRHWTSRSEWAIRILGLSRSSTGPHDRGLVITQIDGLPRRQFEIALEKNNLPFLKRLIEREHYRKHSLYSGMPSNTPAVQAELFYGVKSSVPAFCFMHRKTGRIFKMYDAKAASEVESGLAAAGEPLLKGGSSYANIFTGGADEAHFCAARLELKKFFCLMRPWAIPAMLVLYADILLRTVVLLAVEFALSVVDCVRGTIAGKKFWQELTFIPARVGVCVLLRELVVVRAQIDVARGLPVIHANFLGYDEQSHRRGPASRFAHWSLRGIDKGIRRLWLSATQSTRRQYDLWAYSDHGQESTQPFHSETGESVEDRVAKLFADLGVSGKNASSRPPVVTAMGPVGHVYSGYPLGEADREKTARALVMGGVPIVLSSQGPASATAWTSTGKFELPADGAKVLDASHPFLEETVADLVAMCAHEDAGDFILSGWRAGGEKPVTFPKENGSHAGPGAEETHGFALLSADAPLPHTSKSYLRPLDIRHAALRFLGRAPESFFAKRAGEAPVRRALRLVTYNVHGCVGMDGRLSPDRIARVIARHDVDVVALQELDAGRSRSGGIYQAEAIAKHLDMAFHFHPTFLLEDGQYGNAILSRYPMRLRRMGALPAGRGRDPEPRGALWVEIDVEGVPVQFLTTHLSIWPKERLLQAEALVGPGWLGSCDASRPTVLCGDMNALPSSPAYKRLTSLLRDAQLHLDRHVPLNTWLGRYPLSRIDHVFASAGIDIESIRVPLTELDKAASDHLPLVVELGVCGRPAPLVEPADPADRPWVIRKDPSGSVRFEKESRNQPR
jgi:endonuclease/exonuclease/phosphatase family metal-dependent hydrolase